MEVGALQVNAIRERYQEREGLAKRRGCIIVDDGPRIDFVGNPWSGRDLVRLRSDFAARALGVAVVAITLSMALAACERPEPGPAAKPIHQSRAKSQFDAGALEASMVAVRAWHDSVGPGVGAGGSTAREEVVAAFDGLDFEVNDELQILWSRWVPDPRGPALLGGFELLSATGARARYDALRTDRSIDWRPNWVPVLESDHAWIAVECSRSTAPAGPVVFHLAGEEPVIAFTNLTRFFETLVGALDHASWNDGRVEIPRAELERAHGASNPGLTLPDHLTEH